MLAKNVNDNACFLDERGAWKFFASKLAPTGSVGAQAQDLRAVERVRQVMPLHPECLLQALWRQHL